MEGSFFIFSFFFFFLVVVVVVVVVDVTVSREKLRPAALLNIIVLCVRL